MKKIITKDQKKVSLKIEDQTLNQEQLRRAIINAFNDFLKYHINYKRGFEFFYDLPDDFFTEENGIVMDNYAKIYFDYQIEKIKNGTSKHFTQKDIVGFWAMHRRFVKELNQKRKLMKKLSHDGDALHDTESQHSVDGLLQG